MSVDYAAGLSHYDDLGVCGLDEVGDLLYPLLLMSLIVAKPSEVSRKELLTN